MRKLERWPIRSTKFPKQLSPRRNIILKGSAEMKHVLASLTVAVCLLLPSAGVALAANPHPAKGTTGRPGTNSDITCNSTTTGGLVIGGGPGGATSGNGSVFNTGTSTTPPF